jgi:hypothetical protein
MGSSDGTSRNNKRPRGVAETFQVSEHIVECHCDETSNVFANDPSGSRECNDAAHLRPEVTVVSLPFCSPATLKGWQGKPPQMRSIRPSRANPSASMVWMSSKQGTSGQCFASTALAVFVTLAEGDGSHACAFEPEAESANAAEEVEHIHVPREQLIDAKRYASPTGTFESSADT